MIIYALGLLDLLAGISLILLKFKIDFLGVFFALYLIIKGVVFFRNIVSLIDLASGIVFFIALYGYYNIAMYVAAIWILQKGIISFFRIF